MLSDLPTVGRRRFKFTRIEDYDESPKVSDNVSRDTQEQVMDQVENNMSLSGLHGADISLSSKITPYLGGIEGLRALTLRDCRDCRLRVDVPLSLLNLYHIENCKITVFGVKGAIHLLRCSESSVEGFCNQLRITDSSSLMLHVQTRSSTALANSTGIKVGAPPTPDSLIGRREVLRDRNGDPV